jgi:hypothetical protein
MKAFIIIALVVAVILGGLLALRSSRNTGMPGEDVLKRATRRAQDEAAKDEGGPDGE